MDPLTPDATQNAPVARQIISSFNDMTEEERHLADQIIDVLAERNLSNERANDETRRGFWNAVFRNGWNTNELSIGPGELPDRQFRESALLIGHFSQDLPPSKGVVRKASKSETPLPRAPVHRRQFAPAYLKPNINWDSEGIVWMYTDAKGQAANPRFITLKAGFSHQEARVQALIQWDEAECTRIGNWNYLMAVYIARNRLSGWIAKHPRDGNPQSGVADVIVAGNLDELVQIRTAGAMLNSIADMAENIRARTGGRVGGVQLVTKGL
jgi:hypothetical protein